MFGRRDKATWQTTDARLEAACGHFTPSITRQRDMIDLSDPNASRTVQSHGKKQMLSASSFVFARTYVDVFATFHHSVHAFSPFYILSSLGELSLQARMVPVDK